MENSENSDQELRPEQATPMEVLSILSEQPELITQQLKTDDVEVSLPLDEGPLRVLVRVKSGDQDKIPEKIQVDYGKKRIEIPLEVSETYESVHTR